MSQKAENHPSMELEEALPENSSPMQEKAPKGRRALWTKRKAQSKETDEKAGDEKEDSGIKGMQDFTVLLTNLMTLLAWRTMDLARAEYEGKAFTYWFCQTAIIIILAAMFLHLIHMIGYKRGKAVLTWISGACTAVKNFWKRCSRWGKAGMASVLLAPILLFCAAYFLPWTRFCTQVVDCFGIPAGSNTLSRSERQGRAGCWRIDDYPLQHRMTLTYMEAYGQLDVMSQYSTLYGRDFFQPTARIEIEYRKDKEFYKGYSEDSYSSASRIGYRVPLHMSYFSSSNKLVLELERDSYHNMEIVTYSPEDKPQLLNATLLRIPDGQTGEKGIFGQKIETVYRPDGLPELRRLYADAYNLYGVNGERYSYNRDQQISSLCYLDAAGEPACNKLGVMMVEFEYQDDANLQSIRYYGDQKGSERVEGFHGVFCEILEYDGEGKNISSRRQKDRSESWCFDADGVYQYCYQYEDNALVREEFLAVDNAPIQNIRFNSRWLQFHTEDQGRRLWVDLEPVTSTSEDRVVAVSNLLQAPQFPDRAGLPGNEFPNISSDTSGYNQETAAGVLKGMDKTTKDTDLEPVPSRRYSRIVYTLENGVVTEISYWDDEGLSVPGEQGCAATRFEHDQLRVIRESYWDGEGNPCILSGGYAAVEYVYDSSEDHNLMETVYLDAQGQPVMNQDLGCAIVGYERSGARQELVQTSYYDKGRSLIPLPDKGYAKVEQRYNTNGFLIQETFYDANGVVACRTNDGVAKVRYEYASDGNLIRESYWDQEDNAVSRRDTGYAVVNQVFTYGQLTEKRFETYRDRAYHPIPDRETGAAVITYQYKDGQKVEEQYLDSSREPVLSSDLGCASLVFEYTHGRLSKKSAFGLQGKPILRKDTGCSVVEYEYDEFGRQKELRYLDTEGEPICRSDTGYAKIKYEYDVFGRNSSTKYYDTADHLVINKETGYAGTENEYPDGNTRAWRYIGLDGKGFPMQGITGVTKVSDSSGKELSENYQDAEGKPAVWRENGYSGLSYDYDENGLKTQASFFGTDGELALRLDEGYARSAYTYDSAGRVIRIQYEGENEEPVTNTKYHCAGVEYEYDERGLQSVIRYLGLDGEPGIRTDYGVSEVNRTYDSAGNQVGEAYYADGKPAVRKERGYASYKAIYENGLWVESRYFDTEGRLTLRSDRGYAIIQLEYDDYGRRTRESFYDADENPVISPYYNCAGIEYEYNERGLQLAVQYLNIDGKPMVRQDLGYAEILQEYDDVGNMTAQRYLDASGEPAVSSSRGFASYLDTYNEKGKCTKSEYFDAEGKPTPWKGQGHCVTKREYDPFGQLTAIYYYDADGNLTVNREEGCAGYRYAYDNLGNWTDTWYVSPEGEGQVMVRESYGYAHVSYKRNEFGQETEIHYYLTEDKTAPALVKEKGYSGIRKTYQNHNLMKEEYLGVNDEPVLRSDEGYSVVKYTYDAYGKNASTLYYDTDGESLIFNQNYCCAGLLYAYDAYGNQTDIRYLDTEEEPLLRKDLGLAHIVYEYDSFGNKIHRAHYADFENRELIAKKDEGYAYSWSDYQDGKCVETRFYNAQDQLALRLDGGYAIVRYEYDSFGRNISRAYLGLNYEPVIHTEDHYASVRWAYDERGNQTDTWYYGLEDAPLRHSEYGYAHEHTEYTPAGDEIRTEYRDENEDLVPHSTYGFAQCEDLYDEHGNWLERRCRNAQGDLVRRSDEDYAIVRHAYDSQNRCIRTTYYDELQQPMVSQHYGCAGFAYEYDEKGNETAIRYLAPGGGLMSRTGYGFAQAIRQYDGQGRLTWERFQDAQGNPAAWEGRGYACYAAEYNDIGKKESEWYFNEAEELVARSNLGYAYIRYQYNEYGLLSYENYYGPDHEPILSTENRCARIGYEYDERGNQTYTMYYGTDQELINREDTGASLCFRVFDDLDRQTYVKYYTYVDDGWQLVNRKDLGYAIMENVYGENGLWLGTKYLDAEEKPVVNPEKHYAALECTYNEKGLRITELYLDAAGNPVDASQGRAKWEWEYDANGHLVKAAGSSAADL